MAPIVLGSQYCDATPAHNIEIIITDRVVDSMVANTRPRKLSGMCRGNCETFITELNPTPAQYSATPLQNYASRFLRQLPAPHDQGANRVQDDQYPTLGSIDPYGDTTFNRIQMRGFIKEWAALRRRPASADEQDLVSAVESLAQWVWKEIHISGNWTVDLGLGKICKTIDSFRGFLVRQNTTGIGFNVNCDFRPGSTANGGGRTLELHTDDRWAKVPHSGSRAQPALSWKRYCGPSPDGRPYGLPPAV
jgi:hypothetical protein